MPNRLDNVTIESKQNKALRLIEYLKKIASLRIKLIRDVSEYKKILWLSDIPHEKGCFTSAWGEDEDYDPDIWVEVETYDEPKLPDVPEICKDWIDTNALRNKRELPKLKTEIARLIKNFEYEEKSCREGSTLKIEYLEEFPDVQKEWERYIEEQWLPWVEAHDAWERVHKTYAELFSIRQEQLKLGEEYELVLGMGLLTWRTPAGQNVRRHLIVADAVLDFDASLGKFTVRPSPEGAKLRLELDMLDVNEQPIHIEEAVKALLADAEGDPWNKECIDEVLQSLIHSINPEGEYVDMLKKGDLPFSKKPIMEYAPALILRRRSNRGFMDTLKRIEERIEKDEKLPAEFTDLVEIESEPDSRLDEGLEELTSAFDGEIFFPKPSNEEQRRIVYKLRTSNGVLVQGPPGTGKSHTIANLICHLLAIGQRVLITAKTPRALQVLEKLIPEELRPLCISVLGNGPEERRSLETSVGGILRRMEEWDELKAKIKQDELEDSLRRLREEQAKVNRKLHEIRESETYVYTVAGGRYRGTAARIAEAVNRDRAKYEWFTDQIDHTVPCPYTSEQLCKLLDELRYFTDDKREELNLQLPESLPLPDHFAELLRSESKVSEEENFIVSGEVDRQLANLLEKDPELAGRAADVLSAFLERRRRLVASSQSWLNDAIKDILSGNSVFWKEIAGTSKEIIEAVEPLAKAVDEQKIKLPEGKDIKVVYEDACRLKSHLESGGKLGWGL
ncbi:MAG: AAA domain-containing protein, partial [Candidatus Methanospirareceae archaeon]